MSDPSANVVYAGEDEARRAALAAWGITPRAKKPEPRAVSPDAKRGRLGLAPGVDADDRHEPLELPPRRAAADDRAAWLSDLDVQNCAIGQVIGEELNSLEAALKRKLDSIESAHRSEVAELKLIITELRCELREMRMVQENARVASRGEQGLAGPRGVPGAQGPVGPRGESGPPGRDAPSVVAWDIDVERFTATPCHSDGTRGVPLNALGLFESYDQMVNDRDDFDAASAAAASRAALEQEAEAARRGLSVRGSR